MKKIFIIHGWEATPDSNWFPWLKEELNKAGFDANVPAMPNTANPQCSAWVAYLQKIIGVPNDDILLVGHSLGAITILDYLNVLPEGGKVGGVILVAGSTENLDFSELDSFFESPLDFEKIKNAGRRFTVIHSDNDPVVPFEMGRRMGEALSAEFIPLSGGGHLNAGDGFFRLPIVLEKILKMAKE